MYKNLIVFDLEWNQCAGGREHALPGFPFEVIEIGAVRVDESLRVVDRFSCLIRPRVYKRLHRAISDVTGICQEDLKSGERFETAAERFLSWCGEDPVFAAWGSMDLTELLRNLNFFGVESGFAWPVYYYDIQKLFGIWRGDKKRRPALDAAVEELGLEKDLPFHRAVADAEYTARVFTQTAKGMGESILQYYSLDYFCLPQKKAEEEIFYLPGYTKYVSRAFVDRESLLKDRETVSIKCPACRRALRKKIRWFGSGSRILRSLSHCPEHGWVKGKLRVKHTDDGLSFAVKTVKLTDDAGAAAVQAKKEEAKEKRKRKAQG